MGRGRTTGRFLTRAELVERVHGLYYRTNMSMSSVARHCAISQGTANAIIDTREWETLQPDDFDEIGPDPRTIPAALGPAIPTISDDSCGDGFVPPEYPCHLPDRIKRDLDLL